MAEVGLIVPMVIMFIVVAIILFVGVTILGNVNSGFDCRQLSGYVNATTDAASYPSGTWAGTCHQLGEQTQTSYGLVVISLIIIAAVIILYVVRTFA